MVALLVVTANGGGDRGASELRAILLHPLPCLPAPYVPQALMGVKTHS